MQNYIKIGQTTANIS